MMQKIVGFLLAVVLLVLGAMGQTWVTWTQTESGPLFIPLVLGWLALDLLVVVILTFSSSAENILNLFLIYWISVVVWAMILGDNLSPSLWEAFVGGLLLFVSQAAIGFSGIISHQVFRKTK